jgi:HEAT repeat protein
MSELKIVKKLGWSFLFAVLLIGPALAGSSLSNPAQSAAVLTLDEILKQIVTYNGGIDSAPFWKLRDYIYTRKDIPTERAECEAKLLQFLGTKATLSAKMAVCRHLRIIGSDKSVPVLQSLLQERETADMALYALTKIPGPAVDKALAQALDKTGGPTRIAVIASLGQRRAVESLAGLAPLLRGRDGELAGAAAQSIGAIGGEAASNALLAAYTGMRPDLRPILAAAMLKCGQGLMAAKNERPAVFLYDKLLTDKDLPASIRRAAMIGKIASSGDQSGAILMEQLTGSDPVRQEAAIAKIRDVFKPEAIGPVAGALGSLPENAQVEVLAVLAGFPRERVLAPVLQAAKSGAPAVRIAAIKTLQTIGDAGVVPFLAETAAKTHGAEQAAARGALDLLKGRPVDEAVLAALAQKPAEEIQMELLAAAAERRVFTAKGAVAEFLTSPSPKVRVQAAKTMRTIGTPSDIPPILDLLLRSEDDTERQEAETTIAVLAQKIADPEGRAGAVMGRLGTEKDASARVRLLGVLPRIGDDASLLTLRAALADPNPAVVDAAVRAFVAWPTTTPIEDVWRIHRSSGDETHKLLALQGFIRMTAAQKYRRPEEAVSDLRLAMESSRRPEEKRLVLAALPGFACEDSLKLAESLLGDPELKAEAQAAADKIKAKLKAK